MGSPFTLLLLHFTLSFAMHDKISVKFLPSGKIVHVPHGCSLLHAAGMAGVWIESPCNGNQRCGKCRVRIVEGNALSTIGHQHLSNEEMLNGWRLACAVKVTSPLVVVVPESDQKNILSEILVDGEEIDIRHDQRNRGHLGLAVDLGTTSVAASLFDLYSGEERECVATHNLQLKFGDDVISRIAYVRNNSGGLDDLQRCAVESINGLIKNLCESCGESPNSIYHISVAGNTTMQQCLIGMDPSPLGEYPFKPAFKEIQTLRASTVGLLVAKDAELVVFPQIGGFVGGDTVAGLLASGFDHLHNPSLFVDIGTNGEIALFHNGRIYAASTAAGPAFEGARIFHGMRAKEGAVDQIWAVGDKLHLHVIGNGKPEGICGSALIDCVSLLLEDGLVDSTGRMAVDEGAPCRFSSHLFDDIDENPAFALVYDEDNKPAVWLTQRDVREFQLASGTIRAGIETLFYIAGISYTELDSITLAGGFGNYIRREKALSVGLLPPVHYMKIHFAGNAALTGAKRGLLSRAEMCRAENLLHLTEHVDLSSHPEFSNFFMECMVFPE